MIDGETVEDGYTHSAESIVADHIERFGGFGLIEYALTSASPSRSADLIRLLGRTPGIELDLRRSIVKRGLASSHVAVRDAALQAAETWEDASLVLLLKTHREAVPWLADYAEKIVRGLEVWSVPVFVRMIAGAKWEQSADLREGEIAADAVTGDLRTRQNSLSFWRCRAAADDRELRNAALAMATARDRLDRLDLVYLDEDWIREIGLEIRATPGNTPVSSLRSSHVDVDQLDLARLGAIAGMIATAHRANAELKMSRLEVLSIIVKAVRDGLVGIDALRGDLREKVEAALGVSW
jgi:hypothetical protein